MAAVVAVLLDGGGLVVQALLPQRGELQRAAIHPQALGHAQVYTLVAVLVEGVVTIIEEGTRPSLAPVAHPAGRAAVACAEAAVVGVAGPGVDVGIRQAQTVAHAQAPVQLCLGAAEAGFVGIAGDVLVVLQRLADHPGDFVVEQLDVQAQVDVREVAVVAQLARAHALLVEVARATGLDEVFTVLQTQRVGREVLDRVAPVDVVLEHVRRTYGLGVHRTQAVARGDQVVDRHARSQRAAGQLAVLEHGPTLENPVFVGAPFELSEQAPGAVVKAAIEVGLRVGTVIAVVEAAEQAQGVGEAQGILDFQVVAGFAGALVDITTDFTVTAVVPLALDLVAQALQYRVVVVGRVVGVARHLFGIVWIELPQPGQLGAESQRRIAGAPYLLAVELLRRALYVQAVLGAEVDVPAHRARVILGVEVGVVATPGDEGEYRGIGVGALVAAFLGRQLPFEGLVGRQGVAGAEVEAGQPAAVAVVLAVLVLVEAIVLHAGHRQAQIAAFPAEALAGIEIVDAILALGDLQSRAVAVGGAAGEDVDHGHQRVGTIADGIGAAEHFDAFDILDRQRDIAPVHGGEACAVHRTSVDQHLHAPGVVDVTAMVVDGRLVTGAVADHHAGHQAQELGDVSCPTGADQLAVEHGHAAGHCGRGLFQACGGQNLRQVLVVDEQVIGHGRPPEQGGQQQQAGSRRRAWEHVTALCAG